MVVFVDLDEEGLRSWIDGNGGERNGGIRGESGDDGVGKEMERLNLNKNGMSEAFGCYPIISQITTHLDINTLSHLSTTCRQIRANLLQFRTHLLTQTLHCTNDSLPVSPSLTLRYRARAADWYFVEEDGSRASAPGKIGQCARDMVGQCRRQNCGVVICRNCSIKPPAPVLLQHRHRRLCKSCVKAPLETIEPVSDAMLSARVEENVPNGAFCTCAVDGVWLCQSCGRSLRSTDATYESIWRWRTRYSALLGGLGTGIGEGDRGVECGRGKDCLAAREVESETDCDAEDARSIHSDQHLGSSPDSSGESLAGTPHQMGPGYSRHEIEGIGGNIKKKLVTMVRVGACVPEFEDEMTSGKWLIKEREGRERSWCGWCCRVIRGEKDYERDAKHE